MATIVKQFKNFSIILATILSAGAVAFGVHAFASHYLHESNVVSTTPCIINGQNHAVIMQGNAATPNHVDAKLCDTLTITNADDQIRLVAFGEHEHHQAYDSVLEKVLQKDQGLTVTLNKTGTFKFHDHLDDTAQGTFTVSIN